LDIGGLIPVIGEPLDGVNAAIYLARGDEVNAALSVTSMVPIVGWVSTGGKLVNKTIDLTRHDEWGTVLKHNKNGILTQGDSKKGWEHIYKNHISGSVSNKTLFPGHLGEAEVKNLVMDSLSKGKLAGTKSDGFKEYVYKPNKYGISEMKTIVDPEGFVYTSYPVKGTRVLLIQTRNNIMLRGGFK
jgi:hypothetical protein